MSTKLSVDMAHLVMSLFFSHELPNKMVLTESVDVTLYQCTVKSLLTVSINCSCLGKSPPTRTEAYIRGSRQEGLTTLKIITVMY